MRDGWERRVGRGSMIISRVYLGFRDHVCKRWKVMSFGTRDDVTKV
jgi:hypothetical protein